jgi:pyrroloquinoline quinone biosynthesis protein B
MKIHILGSAAGGFPRWNCHCGNCNGVRKGANGARPRTQTSIAVSSNDLDWVLLNASPDILTQIRATPALQPGPQHCDSGIAAIMLMDADVDNITGLLMLREGIEIPLYCTPSVWCALTDSLPLVHAMSHYHHTHWYPLVPQRPDDQSDEVPSLQLPKIDGLLFTAIALHNDAPALSPHGEFRDPGDHIGMLIQDQETGKTLFYAPTLGKMEPHVEQAMRMADCVLVDGTLWTRGESSCPAVPDRRDWESGHLPLAGAGGMIETLDTLGSRRKILIHIGNANPVLHEDSEERALLSMHGIELAHDGMEIVL